MIWAEIAEEGGSAGPFCRQLKPEWSGDRKVDLRSPQDPLFEIDLLFRRSEFKGDLYRHFLRARRGPPIAIYLIDDTKSARSRAHLHVSKVMARNEFIYSVEVTTRR